MVQTREQMHCMAKSRVDLGVGDTCLWILNQSQQLAVQSVLPQSPPARPSPLVRLRGWLPDRQRHSRNRRDPIHRRPPPACAFSHGVAGTGAAARSLLMLIPLPPPSLPPSQTGLLAQVSVQMSLMLVPVHVDSGTDVVVAWGG